MFRQKIIGLVVFGIVIIPSKARKFILLLFYHYILVFQHPKNKYYVKIV